MKGFYRFFLILLVLILILMAVIPIFLPKSIDVTIVKNLNAPSNIVFDEINNLKKFTSWNSLIKKDSTISIVYFSPYVGKNASYKWTSDNLEIGTGEMIIKKSIPNKLIETQFFIEEQSHPSKLKIDLKELSNTETQLKWNYVGSESSYFERYLNFFLQDGIENEMKASLKLLNDKLSSIKIKPEKSLLKPNEIIKVYYEGQKMLSLYYSIPMEEKSFNETLKNGSQKLLYFYKSKLKMTSNQWGNLIVYYESWDDITNKIQFYMGYPLNTEVENIPNEMKIITIPKDNVLKTLFRGSNYNSSQPFDKLKEYGSIHNYELGKKWEIYSKIPNDKDSLEVSVYQQIIN